ncbi:N2,N2-dimethylguanosine tRNA methyltransferase [Basidiobolus meristosporus CBS 931.73]|uniref:tRNA (guanine(26)-N(2))-dimethyltransferase n=1 Tax=Basidiobolus meristosporus CBS 931.73 TaxID=1314790 RepID=A0A1Y1XRD2_9FUNG|nr:N2,N2-dimethylguanosine tRNA methyltransferase [Basidiobolus meristosporus CBS 931.73]|eukprot:ORX88056.1 N2,N2-dimethylguanosine tRNA methyltransferase [Basidiobolus meristosporus CBS 931.73]
MENSTEIDQVQFDESLYNKVTEGQATILFPTSNEVFYNPVQQFNRDMSIAAITTWSEMFAEEKRQKAEKKRNNQAAAQQNGEASSDLNEEALKKFTVLEALSATGLRSIRYAKEIPNIKYIVANDLEPDAVNAIKRNIKFNQLSEDLVRPNLGDACSVMYDHRDPAKRYDVIDLDPYGSAVPFIDGAVQAVSDGGLLCVTCTDLAVLASNSYTETCFYKYGGMPVKADYSHEMALRLVLNSLQTAAARYKRQIVPLMSCSIDFYVRLFVRVFTSPAEVKKNASKTSMVYHCSGCKSYQTQPLGKITVDGKSTKYGPVAGPIVNGHCEHCGSKHHVGGPFWGANIHDKEFVTRFLKNIKESKDRFKTHPRMMGMVSVISEELDVPFYYTLSGLTGTLHCNSPPLLSVCSAILHQGYKVSVSHACQSSLKTNAPNEVLWDIMRNWVEKNPVKNISENSPAFKILSKKPSFEANFTRHPEATPESRKIKLVRFQQNPTKNWGPKARHKRKNPNDEKPDAKKQNVETPTQN